MVYRCVCMCVCVSVCVCVSGVQNRHQMTGSVHSTLTFTLLSSLCTSENHLDVIKCEPYLFALLRIFVHFWTCFNINVWCLVSFSLMLFFLFFYAVVFYLSSMVALKKKDL